ncbi:MAG: serine/threonine protein phosphatase [Bacteroidetes bacterium]|nr:serine/threonine protein phosphatase [Bacteroidota bacterium]
MARYAIGDVHGCLQTLEALLEQLGVGQGDTLIFLGDYIDRGPDSKGVIDLLMRLPQQGIACICLKGNHEALMIDACRKPRLDTLNRWVRNGGLQTLQSFGLDPSRLTEVPEHYLAWMEQLPVIYHSENYVCVHAGLDLTAEDPLAPDESAMLWIRNWLDEAAMERRFPGLRVLHGHTPQQRWVLERSWENKRPALDLDTGCVYADRDDAMGWLSAYDLDGDQLMFARYQEKTHSPGSL